MGLRQCCKLHTALLDSYKDNSFPTHTQQVQTAHNSTISHKTVSQYAAPPFPLPSGPCTDSCITPNSCQEIYNRGCSESGVYTIDPGCGKAFNVWCDMQGGGWTVFQRRMDGSVSFNRSWEGYVDGFGDLNREHWLGLDKIHCLTASKGRAELYVDMYDCDGARKYARYTYFHVEGSSVNYKLHVSGYSGTAGDNLSSNNGGQFSTSDRDNDQQSVNCVEFWDGQGWWFIGTGCYNCNLNGPYICGAVQRSWVGVTWGSFRGASHSLKYTEMKMRFI